MANNILLAGDNKNALNELKSKLVLLRECDKINVCQYKDLSRVLNGNSGEVLILCGKDDNCQTLKQIENIKKTHPETEIILYTDKLEAKFMLDAYDKGIYDFITADSENYEITIKLINCIKLAALKYNNKNMELFLENAGILSSKNGLYQFKHIKDAFCDIIENSKIRNGIFVILKLDDEVKTKVSSNRLNLLVKKSIRSTDVAATGSGKIFLILGNTDLNGAKTVVENLQNKMGTEFKLHSGVSKIGNQDFDTIYKNAYDSLQAAIKNDELCVSLTEKFDSSEGWLDDDIHETKASKQFKLFNSAYNNKLTHVIAPCFFRFQKDCDAKTPYININHYTNKVESVFSLKNGDSHSELVIRYDGYTKFIIQIIHKGLDTCENSEISMPINKLTDKELQKLLKKLKQEFES